MAAFLQGNTSSKTNHSAKGERRRHDRKMRTLRSVLLGWMVVFDRINKCRRKPYGARLVGFFAAREVCDFDSRTCRRFLPAATRRGRNTPREEKVSREPGFVLLIASVIWFSIGLIVHPHAPHSASIFRPVFDIAWLASLPNGVFALCRIIWPSRKEKANADELLSIPTQ